MVGADLIRTFGNIHQTTAIGKFQFQTGLASERLCQRGSLLQSQGLLLVENPGIVDQLCGFVFLPLVALGDYPYELTLGNHQQRPHILGCHLL